MAPRGGELAAIAEQVIVCRRCRRLVAHRQQVAIDPSPRYAGQTYWARPVPGFGDPGAWLYVLAMATSAHGGNRTGRAMSGGPTADTLISALHRAGLANQPVSEGPGDGLRLNGAWIASLVRCPPPANRPTAAEQAACAPYARAEVAALPNMRVIVTLGAVAWRAAHRHLGIPSATPKFAHGAVSRLPGGPVILASYHPSRQNTNTGLLTPAMLDTILDRAHALSGDEHPNGDRGL